ncbi:MAG: adenosine-specific kinase, partial [Candidatus Zixiibacteriota bacterium]
MEFRVYKVPMPEKTNVIVGQTHFIKTAEDLYEILAGSVPGMRFGLAFCEASGPCLVRSEGNDVELKKLAAQSAFDIGAGHTFIIYIKHGYPINVLNAIKNCQEVATVFCATANPLQLIIAETGQGRGIAGVIDGYTPKRIETEEDVKERRQFLRKIG